LGDYDGRSTVARMSCDAAIRPFPNATEVRCGLDDDQHGTHSGTVRDYAYLGSRTKLVWEEDDRRNFHGPWPGPCPEAGCALPNEHRGDHA
jgi:hypothetical protein